MTLPLPPGRTGLPLLGETLDFAKGPLQFIDARIKQHGRIFKSHLFGEPVVFLAGPDNFGVFLDPEKFTRESASPAPLRALLGETSVPFLDGPTHLVRKRLLMKAVGRDSVAALLPVMESAVAAFLTRWAGAGEIALASEIQELAFAVMDAIFTGADPTRADPGAKRAFDDFVAGLTALPIRLPGTRWSKALAARETLLRYFDAALSRHRAEPPARFDVMVGLLAAELDGARLTDEQVRNETLHFFFAAYAGMFAWLTDLAHALTSHSDVQEQLRFEISVGAPAGALTLERLARLQYLDRVAREVKRSYPVIPITFFGRARVNVEVSGVRVPAGWRAVGCTVATTHDPSVWESPDKFDPERFAPPRSEHEKSPNAFVPQGGGHIDGHRCAGEQLSDALLKVFAIHLLRGYRWDAPEQDMSMDLLKSPPEPKSGLRVQLRAE